MNQSAMFFSDLDRTLIYSKRFTQGKEGVGVPVEHKEGKAISWMTPHAFQTLETLRKQLTFVPVTARKRDEIERIEFIRDNIPEYMICEAGRVIYHRGERLSEWDTHIERLMINRHPDDVRAALARFYQFMQSKGYPAWAINEYMHMTKIEGMSETDRELILNQVPWYKMHGFDLLIQERKVYLIPETITKQNAVRYLILVNHPSVSVSAGDADMDAGMFIETTFAVAPAHHTIDGNVETVTQHTGIKAAEDILQFVGNLAVSLAVS